MIALRKLLHGLRKFCPFLGMMIIFAVSLTIGYVTRFPDIYIKTKRFLKKAKHSSSISLFIAILYLA